MDLFAYTQIDKYQHILESKKIHIPRLRGLRLMSEEKPAELEVGHFRGFGAGYKKDIAYCYRYDIENLIREHLEKEAIQQYIRHGLKYGDSRTKSVTHAYRFVWRYTFTGRKADKKYMHKDSLWSKVHGKLRKKIKLLIKHNKRKRIEDVNGFNNYVGQNVLCAHARIGGNNWPIYKDEVMHEPWFIEKIDDSFDDTYCNVYIRLGEL